MPNSSRATKMASPRQIEVLVVQSNPADTLLTLEAFHAAGLTNGLSCVTEGEDALNYVGRKGKYAHVPSPDLIFLDLSQPRVSGLEVLKVIKSTPELMHIPIVVAAGSDDPQVCAGGLRAQWQLFHSETRRASRVRSVYRNVLRILESCSHSLPSGCLRRGERTIRNAGHGPIRAIFRR